MDVEQIPDFHNNDEDFEKSRDQLRQMQMIHDASSTMAMLLGMAHVGIAMALTEENLEDMRTKLEAVKAKLDHEINKAFYMGPKQ